jgi:phosphoglucosamine mutase
MVESALIAGFIGVGANVVLLGPLPTPAISMLTRSLRADLGVMISASHNPHQDNGIKFFNHEGFKISTNDEKIIESMVNQPIPLVNANNLGKAKRLDDAAGRYIEFVKATFPRGMTLEGVKIVIDCANGAAYKVAPTVLWELGAEIINIGNNPNGININDGCGATCPKKLQNAVLEHKANIGIALDGDADRVIMVDENGQIVDGDQIMALIAKLWFEQGLLKGGGVVATHMSNLGFERYLQSKGLKLYRTNIGDRYVLEEMLKNGCNLGGEQSGHIIFSQYCNTGDGLVAALQVLSLLVTTKMPASFISKTFNQVPQILKNVRTKYIINLNDNRIQNALKKAEIELKDTGRILVRKSGTEPLIRIMVQGDDDKHLRQIVDDIECLIMEIDKDLIFVDKKNG